MIQKCHRYLASLVLSLESTASTVIKSVRHRFESYWFTTFLNGLEFLFRPNFLEKVTCNDIWTKEPWLKFINSYIVACYLLFRKLMEGLCSRWCTNYFVGYRLPTTLLLWYVMISWLLPLDLKWKWGWATSINTI